LTGCNNVSASSPFSCHDTKKLTNYFYADLVSFPLLTLNKIYCSFFVENEIHASISSTGSFTNAISLSSEVFSNQEFKFLPRHVPHWVVGKATLGSFVKLASLLPIENRNPSSQKKNKGKDILTYIGKSMEQARKHISTDVAYVFRSWQLQPYIPMQKKICNHCK